MTDNLNRTFYDILRGLTCLHNDRLRSVEWLTCQLRVACPALNSFSSYVVNNFEELNDMNTKALESGSFKLLCLFPY